MSAIPPLRLEGMLKKPASFVLVSLKVSTYRRIVRLNLSFTAASLDGLFEHRRMR